MENWEVKMERETKTRKLRAEMRRLRAKLAARKALDDAKRKEMEGWRNDREPLYDDVYFRGLEWLATL